MASSGNRSCWKLASLESLEGPTTQTRQTQPASQREGCPSEVLSTMSLEGAGRQARQRAAGCTQRITHLTRGLPAHCGQAWQPARMPVSKGRGQMLAMACFRFSWIFRAIYTKERAQLT